MSKLDKCIDTIIQALTELKQAINETLPLDPKTAENVQSPIRVQTITSGKSDFETLKEILFTDQWPNAVNRHLICDPNNEQDKLGRGRGVLELMVEEDLKNIKFLDYGCGEGQTAYVAADLEATLSVGFDRKNYDIWNNYKKDNLKFTTTWQEVADNGPYDVILIFDVIDHLVGEKPSETLTRAKDVLKPGGKIYVRTHPFTSRHAPHAYNDLNKAFVHLVFTPEELKQITKFSQSKYVEPTLPVVFPLKTYKELIGSVGLKIIDQRELKETVEPFFKTPMISQRIIKNVAALGGSEKFPDFQMSLQFVDFVVGK